MLPFRSCSHLDGPGDCDSLWSRAMGVVGMQDRWLVYLLRYRGTDPKGRKVWAEGIPAVQVDGRLLFLMAQDTARLLWLDRYRSSVEAREGKLKLYEFEFDRIVTNEELPSLTCQNRESMIEMFVYMSR